MDIGLHMMKGLPVVDLGGVVSGAGAGLGEFIFKAESIRCDGWVDGVVVSVNRGPLKGGEQLGMAGDLADSLVVESWE